MAGWHSGIVQKLSVLSLWFHNAIWDLSLCTKRTGESGISERDLGPALSANMTSIHIGIGRMHYHPQCHIWLAKRIFVYPLLNHVVLPQTTMVHTVVKYQSMLERTGHQATVSMAQEPDYSYKVSDWYKQDLGTRLLLQSIWLIQSWVPDYCNKVSDWYKQELGTRLLVQIIWLIHTGAGYQTTTKLLSDTELGTRLLLQSFWVIQSWVPDY